MPTTPNDYGLPWRVSDYTGAGQQTGHPGIASDSWETFIVSPGAIPSPEVAQRIADCCNALVGIEDPRAVLNEVRAMLDLHAEDFEERAALTYSTRGERIELEKANAVRALLAKLKAKP